MKAARIESRSAQRIADPAGDIDPDHDRRQHIPARAAHLFADGVGRRSNHRNRMHDCARVMALDVAVVSERAVHQRGRHAIGSQRRAEHLRFRRPSCVLHETSQDIADVIPWRRGRKQRADAVQDYLFRALHNGAGICSYENVSTKSAKRSVMPENRLSFWLDQVIVFFDRFLTGA